MSQSYRMILLLIAIGALVACAPRIESARPTVVPTRSESHFRSDRFHLEVTLPQGWVVAEGLEYLARPFTGLVAFNSWNEPGFWAPEVTTGNSNTYSLDSILGQVSEEGAYVVLVHLSGGPPLP